MQFIRTDSFEHDFLKLSRELQTRCAKQLFLLGENPRHPSLHIKKIRGTQNIFEGRVTRSYRFTFEIGAGMLLLRRVGAHDKTLKNP